MNSKYNADKKTLTIETDSYNDRRYGRPYIAEITFPEGCTVKGEVRWGQWAGSNGDAGTLILENVTPGACIMQGQRDNRKMRNSAPDYYTLTESGELVASSTGEHYKKAKGL